jgi:hypothetical protein
MSDWKDKYVYVTKDENTGVVSDDTGTTYKHLTEGDICMLYEVLKGDRDSQNIAEIYEKKVPKILYDTEIAVRSMRSRFNVD